MIEGYLQYNFRYNGQGWPVQCAVFWEEVIVRTRAYLGEELAGEESKHKGLKVEECLAHWKTGKPALGRGGS